MDSSRRAPVPQSSDPNNVRLSNKVIFGLGLLASGLLFAVYAPSLGFQFILDDHRFVMDPRIQNSGYVWDYFTNFVWAQVKGDPPSFYRPIFLIWMRVNSVIGSLSPWAWHFLSVVKHVAVAALLFVLVRRLLQSSIAALLAASLFALHPAQTESVSWVTVPDPIMSAGLLLSLLFYVKYLDSGIALPLPAKRRQSKRNRESRPRSTPMLVASVASYACALMTKETAIVFPGIILALAVFGPAIWPPNEKGQQSSTDVPRSRLSFLRTSIPFLVVTALYLLVRLTVLSGRLSTVTQPLPIKTVLLSVPATLWFYVKAMFWPIRSYSFGDPILPDHVSLQLVFVPLLGLLCAAAGLFLLCWAIWKLAGRQCSPAESPGVRASVVCGALLLVLPLLPALNITGLDPGDYLHGRYTYLPIAGLALIGAAAWRVAQRWQLPLLCLGIVLVPLFAIETYSQEQQWQDDSSVFSVAHQIAPRNPVVAKHLADSRVQAALLISDEGKCSEAMRVYDDVLQQYPEDWFAWVGRGYCFLKANDLPRAEEALHRAADISHDPHVIEQWQQIRTQLQDAQGSQSR